MGEHRVVILGGRGMLGTDLTNVCANAGYDVESLDLPGFDITDDKRLAEAVALGDVLVNCAAYTNVDEAETEYDLAYQVNAAAVGNLGALAHRGNKWVLHVSTDFVFDGRKGKAYSETDLPNPINAYGQTKLAGEQLLARSGCRHCILRVQWTYGLAGDNFAKKIISRAQRDGHLKVVNDQRGSPTATTEIARVICNLVPKEPVGCFHYAAAGEATRFEVAAFILERLGIEAALSPCRTADFEAAARRPLNSLFDCSKIQKLIEEPIAHWKVPLGRFLEQL